MIHFIIFLDLFFPVFLEIQNKMNEMFNKSRAKKNQVLKSMIDNIPEKKITPLKSN